MDAAARKTTENNELFNLADTERDMVYLDHTLKDQNLTVNHLMERKEFLDKLDNESLVYDIKLRQKFANKLVTIYRDLLETIGGLFSDMMDNNLNHLMKYLDSAALVVCSAIINCWTLGDQHTGGLPGKDNTIGTILVFWVSCLIRHHFTAVYLSKKDFSKTK